MKQKTRQFIIFTFFFMSYQAFGGQWMLSYALKQGLAQGTMLLGAKKIKNILKDPLVPETTLRSLRLSQEVVAFAEKIPMKTGASYRKFVSLDRDWVTQVVVAAYKDRLEVKKFHFPIVGDFPYKGFFDEDDAKEEEQSLATNFDVIRRKVPAFSSLGWFADPLFSNMITNDAFLVETLFHELLHLNFYFPDTSDFNEAFATWFSYKAAKDFIENAQNVENKETLKTELDENEKIDLVLNQFVSEIIEKGNSFYLRKNALQERSKYFSWIKECAKQYPELKGYDKVEWNNASVMSFATYYRLIPIIEDYSQKNKLNYKSFLSEVLKKGEAFAKEIESTPALVMPKRCAQDIP